MSKMTQFGFKVLVQCFTAPNFTQIQPNITSLCTNNFLVNSVCDLGQNLVATCICEMTSDREDSFYVIPSCSWNVTAHNDQNDDIITTTETETTTKEQMTQETTTESIFTTTEIITSTTVSPSDINTNCELDRFQYEADPLKTVHMVYKLPVDDILGGVLYGVVCEEGYVLEFTRKRYEKMKCVCKEKNMHLGCRKSLNFNGNFGRCVVGYEGENDDEEEDKDPDSNNGGNLDLKLNLNLKINLSI